MTIALYHFHVTQIKRSAGQSAVAAAAYRSGEKLHSEYYGEDSDYTRKGGVICSEILLPPHAPSSFSDRETLKLPPSIVDCLRRMTGLANPCPLRIKTRFVKVPFCKSYKLFNKICMRDTGGALDALCKYRKRRQEHLFLPPRFLLPLLISG